MAVLPTRTAETDIVGVVLAGGHSSRLGRDKALLRLHSDETADLLTRTAGLLRQATGRVLVVGREQPGYCCVPDAVPGLGPVGGIASALAACGNAACLVLSCDLPFMRRSVLDRLLKARACRPPGTLATLYRQEETGNLESLVAVYEPEALPFFRHCAQEKLLKISRVLPADRQVHVTYRSADALPFFNINYPADLEIARRVIALLGRD